jgi:hypothetical protein
MSQRPGSGTCPVLHHSCPHWYLDRVHRAHSLDTVTCNHHPVIRNELTCSTSTTVTLSNTRAVAAGAGC